MQDDKITQLLAKWERGNAPGLTLGIVKAGEVIFKRSYGLANLDYNTPISSTTVFRVASLAKQFTAACIDLLAEQGTLSLQQDIRTWLPELPDYGDVVTLEQLIWHTSGIHDFPHLVWGLAGKPLADAVNEGEVYDLLCRIHKLDFAPGTKHNYCNAGYFLMGKIVRKVSGKSLAGFAHEHIFLPLGMTDTHFHDDYTRIVANRAVGYAPKGDSYSIFDLPTCTVVGDDGLFTTLEDMLVWERSFYDTSKLSGRMLQRGRLNDGSPVDYGLGLFINEHKGLDMFWHHGENAGNQSIFRSYPQEGLSIICLANTSEVSPIRFVREIEEILLEQCYSPVPEVQPQLKEYEAADISLYAGSFCDRDTALLIETQVQDDALGMIINGKYRYDLALVGPDKALIPGIRSSVGLEFDLDRGRAVFFEGDQRYALELMTGTVIPPSPEVLSSLAGEYYSAALETTWVARVVDDRLRLVNKDSHRQSPDQPLEHIFEEYFSVQFNLWSRELYFERNDGRVNAMVIFNGDSGPTRFERVFC